VHGRKEIGKSGQFPEEGSPFSLPDGLPDEIVERSAGAELFDQDTVESGIAAEGVDDVMGVAGKADAAQMVQVVKFPLHVMEGAFWGVMGDAVEKFSDEVYPADFIFIEIDIVGCLNLVHQEVRRESMDTEPRKDVTAQISVERVFTGKMSKVFHEIPIGFRRLSCLDKGQFVSGLRCRLQERLEALVRRTRRCPIPKAREGSALLVALHCLIQHGESWPNLHGSG